MRASMVGSLTFFFLTNLCWIDMEWFGMETYLEYFLVYDFSVESVQEEITLRYE